MQLSWIRLQRGIFMPLPSPEEAAAYPYTEHDRAVAASYRRLQLVGTAEQVRERISSLVAETRADEVMVTTVVHSHEARMRSFELLAREGIGTAEGR